MVRAEGGEIKEKGGGEGATGEGIIHGGQEFLNPRACARHFCYMFLFPEKWAPK